MCCLLQAGCSLFRLVKAFFRLNVAFSRLVLAFFRLNVAFFWLDVVFRLNVTLFQAFPSISLMCAVVLSQVRVHLMCLSSLLRLVTYHHPLWMNAFHTRLTQDLKRWWALQLWVTRSSSVMLFGSFIHMGLVPASWHEKDEKSKTNHGPTDTHTRAQHNKETHKTHTDTALQIINIFETLLLKCYVFFF